MTPEIVQMIGSIHEHKGKQELFLEANVDELKTLLEVASIQSIGASNRIEGIHTSDNRLKELVYQKSEPLIVLNRKLPGIGKCLLQPMKAMSISICVPTSFCNSIEICIRILRETQKQDYKAGYIVGKYISLL